MTDVLDISDVVDAKDTNELTVVERSPDTGNIP